MKRYLCLVTLLMCLMVVFTGCSTNASVQTNNSNENNHQSSARIELTLTKDNIGFEELFNISDNGIYYYYYRDRITDTVYVYREDTFLELAYTGFTVMMDPQTNSPMTFDNFIKYIQEDPLVCSSCNYEIPSTIPQNYCPQCGIKYE